MATARLAANQIDGDMRTPSRSLGSRSLGSRSLDAPPLDPRPLDTSRIAHLTRLRLAHFRSHSALDITCGAHAVVLSGANGVGKTNVLEAVSMLSSGFSSGLASGRGLRGASFETLIKRDAPEQNWHVLADIEDMRLAMHYRADGDGRQLRIDGVATRGLEVLDELLPQLWLTPAMDKLFTEGASGRRKFLDRFAQALTPAAARHWRQYDRAMRERNRLLQNGGNQNWLDGLEDMMAVQGVAMAYARLHAFDVLATGLAAMPITAFPRARIALDGELEAQLRTRPALEVEDAFRAKLREMRARDATAGRALSGPHRGDLVVFYADKDMPAAAASTGEQKALLVGLILAQAQSIIAQTGTVPVLLLDEVAAHLDATRRAALMALLAAMGGQVWMTGTDATAFAAFEPQTHIDLDKLRDGLT